VRHSLLVALLLTASILACPETVSAAEPTLRIVANAGVPASIISRKVLKAVYRGDSARWADGSPLKPVDQSVRAPIRQVFTRDVLGDSVDGVRTYWMKRVAEGKGMPPPVKSSDVDLLSHLAKTSGAIGYVAADVSLPPGIKVLNLED
jgi:ABC-type phosphate transport system substrate-binding protein